MGRRLTAAHRDSSLVPGDNLAADPKAQTCSCRTLCRKKGLKDLSQSLRTDSASVIRNDDAGSAGPSHRIPGRSDAQAQPAAPGHGIQCVADQVNDHLPKLTLMDQLR